MLVEQPDRYNSLSPKFVFELVENGLWVCEEEMLMHQSIPAVPIPPPGNSGAFFRTFHPGID